MLANTHLQAVTNKRTNKLHVLRNLCSASIKTRMCIHIVVYKYSASNMHKVHIASCTICSLQCVAMRYTYNCCKGATKMQYNAHTHAYALQKAQQFGCKVAAMQRCTQNAQQLVQQCAQQLFARYKTAKAHYNCTARELRFMYMHAKHMQACAA